MHNFPGFFPALLTYFFLLHRFACGSTTDKRHIYFWLIGQRLSHLFVLAEFSVKASISQLGNVGPIYLHSTNQRTGNDVIVQLFSLIFFFISYLVISKILSFYPPNRQRWKQPNVQWWSHLCAVDHVRGDFYCCASTLGQDWSLNISDPFPVITCLSHCSGRVEVSFLLLLLHTLGHYHKYGTLTLVPGLSGYKLSLQVSHWGLPLILIKAW